MMDLNGKHVELSIRDDGEVVWLNIDGICAVRINNPLSISIRDARKPLSSEELSPEPRRKIPTKKLKRKGA